jgi:hypothetical protein
MKNSPFPGAFTAATLASFVLMSCGGGGTSTTDSSQAVNTDASWRWDLPVNFATPAVPADNPMSEEKFQLGRYLFHDTRLSGNGTQACAPVLLRKARVFPLPRDLQLLRLRHVRGQAAHGEDVPQHRPLQHRRHGRLPGGQHRVSSRAAASRRTWAASAPRPCATSPSPRPTCTTAASPPWTRCSTTTPPAAAPSSPANTPASAPRTPSRASSSTASSSPRRSARTSSPSWSRSRTSPRSDGQPHVRREVPARPAPLLRHPPVR